MICKIADILVDVPAVGDLVSRCEDYLANEVHGADITIRTELFRQQRWAGIPKELYAYAETGSHFAFYLLKQGGLVLHASAVVYEGKAYLFSANSGTGKSTHTRNWQSVFGPSAIVINDDKPALRCIDGIWYAYGTPWCGKDGINVNMKAPLAGICFLKQSSRNHIRRLSNVEALSNIISQTLRRFSTSAYLDILLGTVENLVQNIPVFELENRPEPEAVMLSYDTMRQAAEEIGL